MLGHRTGMIGLPLRLLAREVYDKVCQSCGPSVVALITGEERIIPERARYWICTVEAMPAASGVDFLCVDEIQLCGDRERGHIFTDRLLGARGQAETLFLGSETIRPAMSRLIEGVEFEHRRRYSALSYTGRRKISRMRPRSAIVAFSVDDVYSLAEQVRRQRGGAAVVMGALSPRTRNAQVELYQNGDVDFLVATDAIGMGLNLNIDHVAFAGLTKFDGSKIRMLAPGEIAQIAGRAGRYHKAGTFGVTSDSELPGEQTVLAIEENRFRNLHVLQWRNARLDFRSAGTLIHSLQKPSENPLLVRAQEAEDFKALCELASDEEVKARLQTAIDIRLLWDTCQIPNFRNASTGEHAELIKKVFMFIVEQGSVPDAWLDEQIRKVDRVEGDVDALSRRVAAIRIWTYVSQKVDWLDNSRYWRGRTREVEDRISDALHLGLTKRFVDRRTSVLLKRLKEREKLVASVNEQGDLVVEGELIGRIEGFRFVQAESSTPEEARAVRAASLNVLAPEFELRAGRLCSAPNSEFDLTEQGGLMWGEHAVGRLKPGKDRLGPDIETFVDPEAGEEIMARVSRRLFAFVNQKISTHCEALLGLAGDDEIAGIARGVAYRLVESFGVIRRSEIASEVRELDQEARKTLRKHGVRFGQYTIHVAPVLKPEATRWRIVLWSLAGNIPEIPSPPPPGLVTIAADRSAPPGYYPLCGYYRVQGLAIRIDMLERLLNMLREQPGRDGFEATADMLSITGLSHEGFAELMPGLGYQVTRFERPKASQGQPATAADQAAAAGDDPAEGKAAAGETAQVPATGDAATPGDPDAATGEAAAAPDLAVPAAEEAAAAPDHVEPATGEAAATPKGPGTVEDEATTAPDDAGLAADEATTAPEEPGAVAAAPDDQPEAGDGAPVEPEVVVGYRFVWKPQRRRPAGRPGQKTGQGRRRDDDAKRPKKRPGRPGERRAPERRKHQAGPSGGESGKRPARIDPDNPFSVLESLKDKL